MVASHDDAVDVVLVDVVQNHAVGMSARHHVVGDGDTFLLGPLTDPFHRLFPARFEVVQDVLVGVGHIHRCQ